MDEQQADIVVQDNKIVQVITTTTTQSQEIDNYELQRQIDECNGLLAQKRDDIARLERSLKLLTDMQAKYNVLKSTITDTVSEVPVVDV